jgi:hypothetical protein
VLWSLLGYQNGETLAGVKTRKEWVCPGGLRLEAAEFARDRDDGGPSP